MRDKKNNIFLPILISLAVTLGMFAGYKLHGNMPISRSLYSGSGNSIIHEVLQLVNEHYVDKVGSDSVEYAGLQGILHSLDPHSRYISAQEIKEVNEDLEGEFEGIGIEFNVFKDTVHVLSVMKNGPAETGGLQTGDKIIAVDDKKTIPAGDADLFKNHVKGKSGSKVTITFIRNNETLKKELKRGHIPITSIDAAYMIDKDKGYIRLNRFSGNTYREFMENLEGLKKKGMQKLILDLRDNGGGILEQSVDIIDEFIGGDQTLVYTQGTHHPKKEYRSKRQGSFENEKLVVLINESSASASEIIAGALQDLERATIIGRKSFGKGLVQEQYYLTDGSALRLTTARYFTPLGRSIQKPYGKDLGRKQDSMPFKTRSGKMLYGGGGITPDILVTGGTAHFDSSLYHLYAENILENFAYKQLLSDKKKMDGYASFEEFYSNYNINENILMGLVQDAKNQNIDLRNISSETRSFVQNRIKALIAGYKWNESGYYKVINREDKTLLKAIDFLNQD